MEAKISAETKEEILTYLKHLNEYERIKIDGTDKERLIFKNSSEVFKIFGENGEQVLNPFNDYTYEWLNSFLYNVIDYISKSDFENVDSLQEEIQDNLNEWVDSETSVYTSDLTHWLDNNNSNVYYLEEAIKEYPTHENHLMLAQYKAIEELYYSALTYLINDLKNNFDIE